MRGGSWQRLLALALPALGVVACSPGDAGSVSDGTGDQELVVTNPGSFIDKMPAAPFVTHYRGTRRIELYFELNGISQVLEYREEVGADGEGNFAIKTLELLSPNDDPELFIFLQDLRQGLTYRYRDFQIRNLDKFRENYTLSMDGSVAPVAGVACIEMHVERQHSPLSRYHALVDPQTGLVLRWEERDAETGALRGRMEFETFVLDADVSDMNLASALYPTEVIDLDGDDGQVPQLGFEVLEPILPPNGFELEEAIKLTDSEDQDWAKLIYTDGVERVVFMHREQNQLDPIASRVERMTVGSWTIVTGNVNGVPLISLGKVDDEDLLLMIQSAFVGE